MTINDLKQLSEEEINKRVAVLDGWEPDQHFGGPMHWHKGTLVARSIAELPAYATDLNAMHEAENWLLPAGAPGMRKRAYSDHLSRLATLGGRSVECATARQRAEALIWTVEGGAE